ANSICSSQLGAGYKIAEHHDGRWVLGMSTTQYYGATWPATTSRGGWTFWANGNISSASRFWVYINNQDANCW
ncbi:MAG: hypothetical protein P9X22_01185, partial [Candidatus Zapsychrus exili]|nr:hypothetical protein [Candidatus Zapsychrus exili]